MKRYEYMSKEELIDLLCNSHPCKDCRAYTFCKNNHVEFSKRSYGCRDIIRDYIQEEMPNVR